MNISEEFQVFKISHSLYQIGELDIDSEFKDNIISLLEFGNKFVPNYFFNSIDFFNYLLCELDNNLLDLNMKLFFLEKNNSQSILNNYCIENNLNEMKIDNRLINSMFTKIKKPKVKDSNNFFISKEVNEIRSKVHSNLFDQYNNIEIKPNITFKQLQALIIFKKEKKFKIINCDKNVGNAFISNELYTFSAYKFLNSDNTFEKLLRNPLQDTISFINTEIQSLCDNGHISEKLRKNLLYDINNSKLGSFRLLAKLHKPTFSWRPIVNCKDHPNSRICFVIDYILKQIVRKTETYLRDSQNLIQKINNLYFEKEPYLYSLDIV